MDTFTPEQRTRCMSRIRSKNTKPELVVRRALTNLGVRYRLYDKRLPGKPDIINRKRNFVLFINGCFWHQHEGCSRSNIPKSNTEYWVNKLERNVNKQKADVAELKKLGFNIFIVWECQTKDEKVITDIMKGIISN